MDYEVNKIKVEKLEKTEGQFENQNGQKIDYANYTISFTVGDYPLIFKAKVDKVLKNYIDEAYQNA